MTQKLGPLQLIVERTIEHLHHPPEAGRVAALRRETQTPMLAVAATDAFEVKERASLEGTLDLAGEPSRLAQYHRGWRILMSGGCLTDNVYHLVDGVDDEVWLVDVDEVAAMVGKDLAAVGREFRQICL